MSAAPPASARAYPERPLLGASIAVFRQGRVLLVKRAGPPFSSAYTLPGGLVEAGEGLESAALRELREETGVSARICGFNRNVEVIERDEAGKIRHHFVIASFAGEWTGGDAMPGPELCETVWVEPGSLCRFPCTPQIREVIESAETMVKAQGAASKKGGA